MKALRARLTGRAARFVHLLQDFGHLDEEELTDLFEALAELGGSVREEPIDLPDVRRVAAALLFTRYHAQGPIPEAERTILAEDWPILFS